ncbi:Dvir\GJ23125-PA-like protein [Anopheles sinensis]|uniref:Dvir\GJ23125-PA-like protein n=1 Tax=Anopheles sinensis TaxID=74873 RepID=A0A084VB68_ANOSI|nr:Dvir\GJ23125-PA-like protein [Anopheles sinensis]
MLDLVTDIAMASSSSQMEISEPFRTEDLSKTDFFDFVTGSAPEMAITSSSSGNTSNGGGGSLTVSGGNSCNTSSSSRTLSSALPGMTGTTVTDRPPGGRGGGNEATTMDGSRDETESRTTGNLGEGGLSGCPKGGKS